MCLVVQFNNWPLSNDDEKFSGLCHGRRFLDLDVLLHMLSASPTHPRSRGPIFVSPCMYMDWPCIFGVLAATLWVQKPRINICSAIHNKLTVLYTCWKSTKAKDIPRIPTVAITVMNNDKCVFGSLICLFSLAPGENRSAENDVGLYSKWRCKCCWEVEVVEQVWCIISGVGESAFRMMYF